MSTPEGSDEALLKALQSLRADERDGLRAEAASAAVALRKRVEKQVHRGDGSKPSETSCDAILAEAKQQGVFEGLECAAVIGGYKLLQKIGEGGCGVVYMAEETEPTRRRVALKVIKPGMDTDQVLARFEAERQALALLDHPNIGKVLDAGCTPAGRPFFVMELVKGIPITDYCDQNRLGTKERLDFFIQVCQAVLYAHQKEIIHRNIKPSNILVDDHNRAPLPKIIDFGIAKATIGTPLRENTLFTVFEQFRGAIAYISPEQAELGGLDADARTDIYSLGVLLYELLTGRTPFDAKRLAEAGLNDIRRMIGQEDPPRPSTRLKALSPDEQTTIAQRRQSQPLKLANQLRDDLDWIVMKAMEKDRTRRYETAKDFASDLVSYLKREPAVARLRTAGYWVAKSLSRFWVAVTTGWRSLC